MVKRKLEDEDKPPPMDDVEAWVSHARLARHVRRLLGSKHPMAVLKRYEDRAHEGGQRCCVHVAAWVALLPEDSELLTPAVDLLAQLLATRPRTRYRPWLEGSLRVVARRSTVFRDHPSWRELKKRLPRKIWDTVDATSEVPVEVKRLHTAIAKWHNANAAERNEILEKVREKLANSSGEQRFVHLIVALRKLVAALSPPQALGVTSGSGQTEAEMDLGPSQQKLRRILLKVLKEIDLTDAKVKPILSHLNAVLIDFDAPLEEAVCAHQWVQISSILQGLPAEAPRGHGRWSEEEKEEVWQWLQEKLQRYAEANSVLFERAAKKFQRSSSSIKAFYRARTDPRYSPAESLNLKHDRGIIKEMVGEAMRKLGGEATSMELIDCIRTDAQIQRQYGPRLQTHMTKINGNMYSIPAWQRTVRTNVDRYLEHSGRKRRGRIVYRLKRNVSRMET